VPTAAKSIEHEGDPEMTPIDTSQRVHKSDPKEAQFSQKPRPDHVTIHQDRYSVHNFRVQILLTQEKYRGFLAA
jgi:hypothetical protein